MRNCDWDDRDHHILWFNIEMHDSRMRQKQFLLLMIGIISAFQVVDLIVSPVFCHLQSSRRHSKEHIRRPSLSVNYSNRRNRKDGH
jgi:hypothetical protein